MRKCELCESTDTRQLIVRLGEEPLHLQPWLCPEHGSSLILRFGMALGSLRHPIEEVFLNRPKGP